MNLTAWKTLPRTSEFWVGLAAAVLAFLQQQEMVSPEVAKFIDGAVVYVVGRMVSKAVKGAPQAPPPTPPSQ